LKSASFDTSQGFGMRAVAGETTGYSHASTLTEEAVKRAGATVAAVRAGHGGTLAEPPQGTNRQLYTDANPLSAVPFETKVNLLAAIDAYARAKDPRVRQVMASIAGTWQAVQILRPDGLRVADIRPLVRLNVAVMVGEGDRQESGSHGTGGRVSYAAFLDPAHWQASVDEALRVNTINGAYASHEEAIKGSITPGKLADFVVLADDRRSIARVGPAAGAGGGGISDTSGFGTAACDRERKFRPAGRTLAGEAQSNRQRYGDHRHPAGPGHGDDCAAIRCQGLGKAAGQERQRVVHHRAERQVVAGGRTGDPGNLLGFGHAGHQDREVYRG